jgi:hypothetical protein
LRALVDRTRRTTPHGRAELSEALDARQPLARHVAHAGHTSTNLPCDDIRIRAIKSAEVMRELGVEPTPALASIAGVPSGRDARRLAAILTERLWS